MKTIKKIIIIILLLVIYTYVCYISFLPSNYIIMQGENLKINTLLGINVVPKESENLQTVQAVSNINQTKVKQVGKVDFSLSLFNLFSVKDVSVNVLPKTKVVPVGEAIRYETLYRWCASSRNVRN